MGIPSVSLADAGAHGADEEDPSQEGAARKTMFGFPVKDEFSRASKQGSGGHADEDSEYAATQIVAAEEFSFDDAVLGSAFTEASALPFHAAGLGQEESSEVSPMRSTISGGLPSLDASMFPSRYHGAFEPSEELGQEEEQEEEVSKTTVSSSSLFKFDGASDRIGRDTPHPPLRERPRKHETLMGMSLDDLANASPKRTLFSIPAHEPDGGGEGLSEFSEEESDIEEDIPTQAVSGAVFGREHPPQETTREQNRQRLLDKLRANSQAQQQQEERPSRSTMFGIPAVDRGGEGGQEDDSRQPALTPHTGVLKVARRADSPAGEFSERPGSGVLGASSYLVAHKDASEPREVPSEPHEAPSERPAFNLSEALKRKKRDVASEALPPRFKLGASVAGLEQESSPTIEGDSVTALFDDDDDMTRERSLDDLPAHLLLPPTQDSDPSLRAFNQEDATRQHDAASLREQLNEQLFASNQAAHQDRALGATQIAPAETAVADLSELALLSPDHPAVAPHAGPQFAVVAPSATPPAVPNAPDRIEAQHQERPQQELRQEPLPELAARPIEAAPGFDPMPEPQPGGAPIEIPLIEAVPLPMEPSYKTVTSTASPTPPHGTAAAGAAPSAAPLQGPSPSPINQVGRGFQIVFGVLGFFCFAAATALPLFGVLSSGASLSSALYLPALLSVGALFGALAPTQTLRQVALTFVTLLGIGTFAAGLVLGLPIIFSIFSLVGALFTLTAILFPLFARAL